MKNEYRLRLVKVQSNLVDNAFSAFFVTDPTNIYYLTGFRGVAFEERESTLLITNQATTLFVPKMYRQEASSIKFIHVNLVDEKDHLFTEVSKSFPGNSNVCVESENIKLSEFNLLKDK